MSIQAMFLIMLAFMCVIAFMIALNSRGWWRFRLSFLLTLCLAGATVWLFILHISTAPQTAATHGASATKLDARSQDLNVIANAVDFANELLYKELRDPSQSREMLMARAADTERRFESLRNTVSASNHSIEAVNPEAAKLLERAMAELRAACHLLNTFYLAENAEAESSMERLFRQRAQSAVELLSQAQR